MKRFTRIASALLAVAMTLILLASCGNKTGDVYAAYDGKPVYEGEVRSIMNYYVIKQSTVASTNEEKAEIAKSAIRTYVRYKVLELDLAKKGYKVDEGALAKEVKATIKELNETFEGGYSDWRNMYQVDKNFLKEELRRYEIGQLFRKYITAGMEITEELARQYYIANGEKYTDPAGYSWTAALVEVKDLKDEAELAKAKEDAMEYIRQINGGFSTMEAVEQDISKKYTKEDGYTQAGLYSGKNFTALTDFEVIENLSEKLNKIKESYGELNPDATEKTDKEAYTKYMNYLGECYKAETFYALNTLDEGKVYGEPIKSFAGYFIVRLDKKKTVGGFKNFDDVKESIVEAILTEYVDEQFTLHVDASMKNHNAAFIFDEE